MPRNYLMSRVSQNTLYQPNSALEMVMMTKYYFPTIHSVLKENGGNKSMRNEINGIEKKSQFIAINIYSILQKLVKVLF